MYVYRMSKPNLFTVGFYAPTGKWMPERDYGMRIDAARRVHYLNGGGPDDIIEDILEDILKILKKISTVTDSAF